MPRGGAQVVQHMVAVIVMKLKDAKRLHTHAVQAVLAKPYSAEQLRAVLAQVAAEPVAVA